MPTLLEPGWRRFGFCAVVKNFDSPITSEYNAAL